MIFAFSQPAPKGAHTTYNPKKLFGKNFDIAVVHWTWERNIEKDQQQEKPQYNIVEYATHCTMLD